MSMSLQIALAAGTHEADGLTLKSLLTVNVEQSLTILVGILTLTE
jgi:hypothetical protein